jgi:thiamine biosynthesis lipoprotein
VPSILEAIDTRRTHAERRNSDPADSAEPAGPRPVSRVAITEMIVPSQFRGPAPQRRPPRDAPPVTQPVTQPATWTAGWTAWGAPAFVTVTDPGALPAARRLVIRQFAAAERVAARFRRDAEIHRLYKAAGRPITVSPLLAELVSAALIAAERTGGDVDPTVAAAMRRVHGRPDGAQPVARRRDLSAIPACGSASTARPVPGWEQVHLDGRRLQVPVGTTLDLSATATSVICDQAAARVHDRLGVGVLVGLGGDGASAGPAPDGGWRVAVIDRTGDRDAEVILPAGAALATSHLTARSGAPGATPSPDLDGPGHLIDPRTGCPPASVWRMATAIGFTSLEAATYTSATLVRGTSAREWLTRLWIPARLITVHGGEIDVGPWRAHLTIPT